MIVVYVEKMPHPFCSNPVASGGWQEIEE